MQLETGLSSSHMSRLGLKILYFLIEMENVLPIFKTLEGVN